MSIPCAFRPLGRSQLESVNAVFAAPGGTGNGSSWGSPLGDIQTAVNLSKTFDPPRPVYVKSGTYDITAPITVTDGCQVFGGFLGHERTPEERDLYRCKQGWIVVRNESLIRVITPTFNDSAIKIQLSAPTAEAIVFDGFHLSGAAVTSYGSNLRGIRITIPSTTDTSQRIYVRNCSVSDFKSRADGVGFSILGAVWQSNYLAEIEDCLSYSNEAQYGAGFQQIPRCNRCVSFNNYVSGGHGAGYRYCGGYNNLAFNNSGATFGDQGLYINHMTSVLNTGYCAYQHNNQYNCLWPGLNAYTADGGGTLYYCLAGNLGSSRVSNCRTGTLAGALFVKTSGITGRTTDANILNTVVKLTDLHIDEGSNAFENNVFVPRLANCLYDMEGYKRLPFTAAGAFCSPYERANQHLAGF